MAAINRSLFLVIFLGLAPSGFAQVATAPLEALLDYVPADANAVLALDVGALLASPMAANKGWDKDLAFAFAEGGAVVPPNCKAFVQAARISLADRQSLWEAAAAELETPASRERLRKLLKGDRETAGELDLIWTPRNVYCAAVSFTRLVARAPADRQQFLRWVQSAGPTQAPEYLRQAVVAARKTGAPLVVAVDLADALRLSTVKAALKEMKDLKLDDAQRDALAETVASLRGVRLQVWFGGDARAALLVDFARDARLLQAIPRLHEHLAACLDFKRDALADWSVDFTPSYVKLSGRLTPEQLRRISLLIEARPVVVDESLTKELDKLTRPEATRREFRLIATMIDDLRLRTRRLAEESAAAWIEKYARQIESLPSINVDEELTAYRDDVADRLNRIAKDLRYDPAGFHKRTVNRVVFDKHSSARFDEEIDDKDLPRHAEARAIMGQTARLKSRFKQRYGGDW